MFLSLQPADWSTSGVVAVASIQYVNVPSPVLPAVISAKERSTVPGVQTASGSVICNTGTEGSTNVIELGVLPEQPARSKTKASIHPH